MKLNSHEVYNIDSNNILVTPFTDNMYCRRLISDKTVLMYIFHIRNRDCIVRVFVAR